MLMVFDLVKRICEGCTGRRLGSKMKGKIRGRLEDMLENTDHAFDLAEICENLD